MSDWRGGVQCRFRSTLLVPLPGKPKGTLGFHSVRLSVPQSIRQSVRESARSSVRPSVRPSVRLSVRSISFPDFFPRRLQILI